MIKIEMLNIVGWDSAIRGMRNPMNSWRMSDSGVDCTMDKVGDCLNNDYINCALCNGFKIGPNDQELMMKLSMAGTDHRKFMRMIMVYVDITAPLYWWKEFDTYKIGTVANSCSTMHKLDSRDLDLNDFSTDYLEWRDEEFNWGDILPLRNLENTILCINQLRKKYKLTGDKKWFYMMVQLLPSSYNQKRTVMLNYEVLKNMYISRQNHKLREWRDFCNWIETLPHSEIITTR